MEEYKFSDSNLDFYELLDKYKTLNTTYSDIDDFKINIYENYNLLQDDLITAFTVPSTNIRLSSFKNNYIIADTQTLDLDRAFYTANPTLFSTVEGETEGETYINNIDLTNIITTYFNYANDDIYPSKKSIDLLKQLSNSEYTILGHTHHPFVWCNENRWLVNPGSVGQPRDQSALSSFFYLDLKNKTLLPRKVQFPIEKLFQEILKNDPNNKYLKSVFTRGQK